MLESIKKISNPLTIIAIFAGLAEVSGTVVLPFLKDDSQSVCLVLDGISDATYFAILHNA
jgi:hypothetical protein